MTPSSAKAGRKVNKKKRSLFSYLSQGKRRRRQKEVHQRLSDANKQPWATDAKGAHDREGHPHGRRRQNRSWVFLQTCLQCFQQESCGRQGITRRVKFDTMHAEKFNPVSHSLHPTPRCQYAISTLHMPPQCVRIHNYGGRKCTVREPRAVGIVLAYNAETRLSSLQRQ